MTTELYENESQKDKDSGESKAVLIEAVEEDDPKPQTLQEIYVPQAGTAESLNG